MPARESRHFRRCGWAALVVIAAALGWPGVSRGDDIGAVASGTWSAASTWSGGVVPGAASRVFIGSTNAGGVSSATVALTQNQSASEVFLGDTAGSTGVLNLGNSTLTVTNLTLGGGLGSVTRGTGSISAQNIFVTGTNSLNFGSGDTTANVSLTGGATGTTAAAGNVTGGVYVYSGSTLTLGADLTATVELRNAGSVLDAQGHNITAAGINIGRDGPGATLINRGTLTAGSLNVSALAFQLRPTDAVTNFALFNGSSTALPAGVSVSALTLQEGSTATTASTGNITGGAYVYSGSTLTLGADLTTGGVDLRNAGSVLNAQGHAITAGNLAIGRDGPGATLVNRGTLSVGGLQVSALAFQLTPADTVRDFALFNGSSTALPAGVSVYSLGLQEGSTATTAAAGNVTGTVAVYSGSTLTLGADLTTGGIDMRNAGSVLNAQGHAITAGSLTIGYDGAGATLTNDGAVAVGALTIRGVAVTLRQGNDTVGTLQLVGNSGLRVASANGQGTGLTVSGVNANALNIEAGSKLTLELNGLSQGWVLRWANPAGGNHLADLTGLINQGDIDFAATNGGTYQLFAGMDGYTYVIQPVPEPSLILMLAAAPLVAGYARRRRTRAQSALSDGRRGGAPILSE